MFWNRKTKQSPNNEIRETLFGDLSIEKWTDKNATEEPWKSFELAKELIVKKQNEQAVELLTKITQMENLESRHYVQAYHFLKQLGMNNDKPTELFGVVIEVGMKKNEYDLLAAYSDFSARYYNYTGAGIVWENPNNSLENEIKTVLELGKEVMNNIGPWEEDRPNPVKKGMVRLNLLTSKGLHFGEAPMDVMGSDPTGGGLLNASAILMQKLMEKTENK
jgi:hypothetical protein